MRSVVIYTTLIIIHLQAFTTLDLINFNNYLTEKKNQNYLLIIIEISFSTPINAFVRPIFIK